MRSDVLADDDRTFNDRAFNDRAFNDRAFNDLISLFRIWQAGAFFQRRIPSGGARRDRTDDLMLAKHALSQLSYGPVPEDEMLPQGSA